MHVVPTDGNPQLPGAVEVNLPFQPRLHNLISKILTLHFLYQEYKHKLTATGGI